MKKNIKKFYKCLASMQTLKYLKMVIKQLSDRGELLYQVGKRRDYHSQGPYILMLIFTCSMIQSQQWTQKLQRRFIKVQL